MKKAISHFPFSSKTAVILLSSCILLTFVTLVDSALAQTWYIKPTTEIPLRRGQGTDYKILAIVPNGTAVTISEEIESWAKVTTTDGKEGWILKRYLTEEPPLEERFQAMEQQNAQLKEEVALLQAENDKLHALNTALQDTLENNKTELNSTMTEYQKLVEDTSDVIAIKNSLEQSRLVITTLQQELGNATAENERLKAGRNIKWFLAGGGTLIFGCVVGMISARSKKRKSSLY